VCDVWWDGLMAIGMLFEAYLNSDKIYIDLSYLQNIITHLFNLYIVNDSPTNLFFKVISGIPNWTVTSPQDGKLGSVAGGGGTKWFHTEISRTKPSYEMIESGNLIIEAYSDSEYTNKVSEGQLPVTIYLEDIENWDDVIIYDFNDGTSQGWKLPISYGSITSEESVEGVGYSIKNRVSEGNIIPNYISKEVNIPNRNKVRALCYLAFKQPISATIPALVIPYGIKIDGIWILNCGSFRFRLPNATRKLGWFKMMGDISDYRGQTRTITFLVFQEVASGADYCSAYWDRVVIAGKD